MSVVAVVNVGIKAWVVEVMACVRCGGGCGRGWHECCRSGQCGHQGLGCGGHGRGGCVGVCAVDRDSCSGRCGCSVGGGCHGSCGHCGGCIGGRCRVGGCGGRCGGCV